MYRITQLFLLFALLTGALKAQNYQVNFTGTGASTSVDSVIVQNLTQRTSLKILQGEILHLTNFTTGINKAKNDAKGLVLYPNPIMESGFITFNASANGSCSIAIYNSMGNKIHADKYILSQGYHTFELSGLNAGVYILKVSAADYSYSYKLISKASCQEQITLSYQGIEYSENKSSLLKSSSEDNLVAMSYNDGDLLKLTGISGNYRAVQSIVPVESTTVSFNFIACSDYDNNNYGVISMGTQTWMAENLRTTTFNDGTDIPHVTENDEWANLPTPAYCWYNNDEENALLNNYGALYNWYTVATEKLCPIGWHVPTDAEWSTLKDYITEQGFSGTEGTALKATTNWNLSPGASGSDIFGFTGIPVGYRFDSTGIFYDEGTYTAWFSSTEYNTYRSYTWHLYYSAEYLARSSYGNRSTGLSIRCIKD